jgi:hypothetical protein
LWASACETAIWPAGTFWAAYCGNRDEAVEGVIDADPVAAAVRAVMQERTEWTGTASDLLGALGEAAGERIAKSKTWPDSPRALSGRLRRAATFLRKIGIEVSFEREGRARTRVIRITAAGAESVRERGGAQPSAPSAPRPKSIPDNGFGAPDARTIANDADGCANGKVDSVRANPLKSNCRDDADGADANRAAHSEPEKTAATSWRARL